jgi:hypothetical protein
MVLVLSWWSQCGVMTASNYYSWSQKWSLFCEWHSQGSDQTFLFFTKFWFSGYWHNGSSMCSCGVVSAISQIWIVALENVPCQFCQIWSTRHFGCVFLESTAECEEAICDWEMQISGRCFGGITTGISRVRVLPQVRACMKVLTGFPATLQTR